MSQTKPKETVAGQKCPLCGKGHFVLTQIDHHEECPDSPSITVAGVWVDQCTNCQELIYPSETTRYIENVISEETEELSPRELEKIREDLGLDQTEISEILGLGSKSYHRWEKGTQFPSRSMCYYIRVLAEFPEAFLWLRQRAWQKRNRIRSIKATDNRVEAFPALARLESKKVANQDGVSLSDTVNYPKNFSRIAIR